MIKITKDNIHKETQQGVTAVFFWASWCESCKGHFAHFIQAEKMMEDIARFGAINLDDTTPELLERHKVPAVPCTVFYKDGERKKVVLGVQKIEEMVKEIKGIQ